MQRIIQALTGMKHRDHYVRLSSEIQSDLLWWHRFLNKWNGVGILSTPGMEVVHLVSDVSGSLGCAANRNNLWFQWYCCTQLINVCYKLVIQKK